MTLIVFEKGDADSIVIFADDGNYKFRGIMHYENSHWRINVYKGWRDEAINSNTVLGMKMWDEDQIYGKLKPILHDANFAFPISKIKWGNIFLKMIERMIGKIWY